MDKYFQTEHLKSDLKRRAVRGAGATVLSQIFSFVVHLSSTIILARLLTPDDFGLVTMVTTFSLLLQNFGLNGFTEAIIQKEELNHKVVSTLFWANIGFSLFLTVMFMALSPLMAWFFKEPRLKTVTIAIALSIISSGVATIHLALLKRNMDFYVLSITAFAGKLISVIITIALAWMGWGYWALVVNTIALPLSGAIGGWIFCSWRPGFPVRNAGIGGMIRFAINVYGNFTMNYCSRNIDNLLVGWRYGSFSLGYYKKAYDIFALPVNQLTAPLSDVAVSALSRLTQEPEKYRRYYLDAVSAIAFVGMAVSLVLTLAAKDMIMLVLGPQWGKSGEIFAYFGPGIGIMLVYYTNGWLHLSLGRADRWFRWGIVELIVTSLSFVIGLPFGPAGVAAAWTVSFYLLTGVGLWYAGKPISISLAHIVDKTWRFLFSAVLSATTCWYLFTYHHYSSEMYAGLNIVGRIGLMLAASMVFYLLFIVLCYQSIKPLTRFVSLAGEMVPGLSRKKLVAKAD